jgi:hypothetical protein
MTAGSSLRKRPRRPRNRCHATQNSQDLRSLCGHDRGDLTAIRRFAGPKDLSTLSFPSSRSRVRGPSAAYKYQSDIWLSGEGSRSKRCRKATGHTRTIAGQTDTDLPYQCSTGEAPRTRALDPKACPKSHVDPVRPFLECSEEEIPATWLREVARIFAEGHMPLVDRFGLDARQPADRRGAGRTHSTLVVERLDSLVDRAQVEPTPPPLHSDSLAHCRRLGIVKPASASCGASDSAALIDVLASVRLSLRS